LYACRDAEPEGPPMKTKDTEGTTDAPMDTSTGPAEVEGDHCESPLVVGAGRHTGTLVGAQSELRSLCGKTGPELFFQLAIDRRSDLEVEAVGAGFVPIAGVLQSCDDDDADAVLGCVEGLPMHVLDLAAGSAPIVALMLDHEDPALTGDASGVEFALDLRLRAVLGPGEECSPPGRGRCESGTACLPDADEVERCTVLAADTCATAEPHVLALGESLAIPIDVATPQTDAHAHSCTGARRRDRVLRIEVPADMPAVTTLRIATADADVGLAVRRASCLAVAELACGEPGDAGVELVVDDVATALGSDRAAYVFVELPDATEIDPGELPPQPPLMVAIELVGP